MGMSLEEMYKLAMNPKLFPDSRLLAVMQGRDSSIPMAVAMSAKQMRDKEETAAKGAQAQAQAAQPSVRDQMLAKGMQQQMAGIDQLRAPTMENMGEEGMATGGLVSFGYGGLNKFGDDDDTDDPEQDDQDELDAMMAQQGDLGGLGAGIMAVANPNAAKYSSFALKDTGDNKGLGSFKDIAADAAKRHGASWDLVQHVMRKETGGLKDAANAVSPKGATGVMQLMPATAKELGVKDINDPNENINAGVKYLAQLEKQFKDPKLAAMAYNWGPGNVKKWLAHGAKESAVPKETRMYVASLAQGGIVNLAKGSKDVISSDDDNMPMDDEGYYYPPTDTAQSQAGRDLQLAYTRAKNLGVDAKKGIKSAVQSAKDYFGASSPDEYQARQNPPQLNTPAAPAAPTDQASAPNNGPANNMQGQPTPPQAPPVDPMAASQSRLDKYLANLDLQNKQNAGLGLMGAGLRIAGGTSPYASVNIGQGGAQGIADYQANQKGIGALQAQGLSAQSALDRNAMLQKHYNMLGQQTGQYQLAGEFDKAVQGYLTQIKADPIKKMWPLDKQAAEAQRLAAMQIQKNPVAANRYKQFGIDPASLYTPVSMLSDTPPTGSKEYK